MTSDELEHLIVGALAPLIGESMARGALRSQRQRLQLEPPLSSEDLDRLLQALGSGLNVFIGKHRSAQLMEALRAEILDNPL